MTKSSAQTPGFDRLRHKAESAGGEVIEFPTRLIVGRIVH